MSRVLKIMSIAVVLFLAYMWISVLTKSCNTQKDQELQQLKKQVEKDGGNEEFEDENFFEEDTTASKKNTTIDYNEIDATVEKTVSQKGKVIEEEKPRPAPETKNQDTKISSPNKVSPSTPAKTSPLQSTEAKNSSTQHESGDNGDFVVVAGNYLLESNADVMVKKLKKNGFNGAEKVVFDKSEFFTVIAGKYSSHDQASKSLSALKSKGVDAYVHRKK